MAAQQKLLKTTLMRRAAEHIRCVSKVIALFYNSRSDGQIPDRVLESKKSFVVTVLVQRNFRHGQRGELVQVQDVDAIGIVLDPPTRA